MGERKSGPIGLHLRISAEFTPGSFSPYSVPTRLVLRGPLGTGQWDGNKAKTRGGSSQRHIARLPRELNYEKLYRDIVHWEGVVKHMYLDTHNPPLVTVGAGNMIPDIRAAQSLPFINTVTGAPATREEIASAFEAVAAMKGGMGARKYKQKVSIELAEPKVMELAIFRLKNEFVPAIRKFMKGFDDYPLPAQEALIDIAYNTGIGRDAKIVDGKVREAKGLRKYTHLRSAAESSDWLAASRRCGSSSSRPGRIQWRRDLFELAAKLAAQSNGKIR